MKYSSIWGGQSLYSEFHICSLSCKIRGCSIKVIIIIIIIAPLSIVKEDQWGHLECLHKASQAAILMEAYSQTLALMNDVKMNDRVKMTVR